MSLRAGSWNLAAASQLRLLIDKQHELNQASSRNKATSLIEAAEKSVRHRVPKPRNHLASAQDRLATEALTH